MTVKEDRPPDYGYPKQHLGHLSAHEEESLELFKKTCRDLGYLDSDDKDRIEHLDDGTLLRFLRARHFNVQDAVKQFTAAEDWQRSNATLKLYEGMTEEQFAECRVLLPQWTGRRDKRGFPVYSYDFKNITAARVASFTKSTAALHHATDGKSTPTLVRLLAMAEHEVRFVFPLCSVFEDRKWAATTPISQTTTIVNIAGIGYKTFWAIKHLVQEGAGLASAHYPEMEDRIFLVGAPSYFATAWSWVKNWFDPLTASKFFILSSSNMLETLEQYIDRENIPIQYGGALDWSYGDSARRDPALIEQNLIKWENGHQDFPVANRVYWEQITDTEGHVTDISAVVVLTRDGQEVREVVGRLNVSEERRTQLSKLMRLAPARTSQH